MRTYIHSIVLLGTISRRAIKYHMLVVGVSYRRYMHEAKKRYEVKVPFMFRMHGDGTGIFPEKYVLRG